MRAPLLLCQALRRVFLMRGAAVEKRRMATGDPETHKKKQALERPSISCAYGAGGTNLHPAHNAKSAREL